MWQSMVIIALIVLAFYLYKLREEQSMAENARREQQEKMRQEDEKRWKLVTEMN